MDRRKTNCRVFFVVFLDMFKYVFCFSQMLYFHFLTVIIENEVYF